MNEKVKTIQNVTPSDIARYFLFRSFQDGELITPLRMQKLVYYTYAWSLVNNKKKLFQESIEAWPNGPVIPSLYQELKHYGRSLIDEVFLGLKNEKEFDALIKKFPPDVQKTLSSVYEAYMAKTPFELVVLSHSEKPWVEARGTLSPTDHGTNQISDKTIMQYYGQQRKTQQK